VVELIIKVAGIIRCPISHNATKPFNALQLLVFGLHIVPLPALIICTPDINVYLFVGCFTAHQHLGHIGPTLGGDKEYIRIAISRLLRQLGLGRILPTCCHMRDCRHDQVMCCYYQLDPARYSCCQTYVISQFSINPHTIRWKNSP
jgi:hypothetical protein